MGESSTTAEASSPLFDAWLANATHGLCDFAKTQVREEYEDLFTAAHENLRAAGLGADEAEEACNAALLTLGNQGAA